MNYIAFRKSTVDPDLTKRINKVLESNKWEMRIINVGEMPNAFSMGDTRLYMTSALRKILTDDERVAVMLHEVGHSKFFHIPLTVIHLFGFNMFSKWLEKLLIKYVPKRIVRVSSTKLITVGPWWFVPLLLLLSMTILIKTRRWGSYKAEKQADMFVIKNGYGRHLATALTKITDAISKFKPPAWSKPFLFAMKLLNNHPELEERLDYAINSPEAKAAAESGDKTKMMKTVLAKLKGPIND